MPIKSDQQGFILVAVLAAVMVLGLIAASLAGLSRSDLRVAVADLQRAQDSAYLDAGLNRGIFELLRDASPDTRLHGRQFEFSVEEAEIVIEIEDEAGRIDLNSATPEVLTWFLEALGVPNGDATKIADRIADWRDPDDLVRLNGAERRDYRAQELSDPGNRAFLTLAEIQDVWGVTPELYACMRPYVTLYSGRQAPDPRFMSTGLRSILRSGETQGDDTADVISVSPATLSPRGRVYRIRGVIGADSELGRSREAIVRITGNRNDPYWVLSWRDAGSNESLDCTLEPED